MKFQKLEFLHILQNYDNASHGIPLSQMFEDEKLNIFQGKFEKENSNNPFESASVIATNGDIVLYNFTNNLESKIYLPENIKNLGMKDGLLGIIHNHTNKIGLPSHGDVYNSIALRAKNVISTSTGKYNGRVANNNIFKIKDANANEGRAIKYRNEIRNLEKEMKTEFIKVNPKFKEISTTSKEFKNAIIKYYQKDENMLLYYKKFNEVLPKDIKIQLYNKKTNKYI